jgi:hypothetical protein
MDLYTELRERLKDLKLSYANADGTVNHAEIGLIFATVRKMYRHQKIDVLMATELPDLTYFQTDNPSDGCDDYVTYSGVVTKLLRTYSDPVVTGQAMIGYNIRPYEAFQRRSRIYGETMFLDRAMQAADFLSITKENLDDKEDGLWRVGVHYTSHAFISQRLHAMIFLNRAERITLYSGMFYQSLPGGMNVPIALKPKLIFNDRAVRQVINIPETGGAIHRRTCLPLFSYFSVRDCDLAPYFIRCDRCRSTIILNDGAGIAHYATSCCSVIQTIELIFSRIGVKVMSVSILNCNFSSTGDVMKALAHFDRECYEVMYNLGDPGLLVLRYLFDTGLMFCCSNVTCYGTPPRFYRDLLSSALSYVCDMVSQPFV